MNIVLQIITKLLYTFFFMIIYSDRLILYINEYFKDTIIIYLYENVIN